MSNFGYNYGDVGKIENVHGDTTFDFVLRHETTVKEMKGKEKVLSTDVMDFVDIAPQEP